MYTPCCSEGCTLTQGYWKTHSSYGHASYDATWAAVGENTPFFSSSSTWYSALLESPEGDAYWILAHQYIAAVLTDIPHINFGSVFLCPPRDE